MYNICKRLVVYLPESLHSMEMISDLQDNTNIYSKLSQETCALSPPPKKSTSYKNEWVPSKYLGW